MLIDGQVEQVHWQTKMNNIPKLVVSSSTETPAWNNSQLLGVNPIEELKKLKDLSGQNILIFGSYKLVQILLKENMIDQFRLYIYPFTVGKGKRLFEEGNAPKSLDLLNVKQFSSGVVSSLYQRG